MTSKKRKTGVNATAKLVANMQDEKLVVPPEGVELATEDEYRLWSTYTRLRLAEDWRDGELLFLKNLIDFEVELIEVKKLIFEQGLQLKNQRGTMVLNPLLAQKSSLINDILKLSRALGLLQTDTRVLNNQALQKKQTLDKKSFNRLGKKSSLLA